MIFDLAAFRAQREAMQHVDDVRAAYDALLAIGQTRDPEKLRAARRWVDLAVNALRHEAPSLSMHADLSLWLKLGRRIDAFLQEKR